MCEPTTLLAISVGLSGLTALSSSSAAKGQAEYQAKVSENNTIIAGRQAVDATNRGRLKANKQKQKGKQLYAQQLLSLAAQGVDVSSGTSIDLLGEGAEASKLEEQIIKNNANREAYNHQVAANNHRSQSGLYQSSADAQNPLLAAATAGVTTAVNTNLFGSKWYKGNNVGNTIKPNANVKQWFQA